MNLKNEIKLIVFNGIWDYFNKKITHVDFCVCRVIITRKFQFELFKEYIKYFVKVIRNILKSGNLKKTTELCKNILILIFMEDV